MLTIRKPTLVLDRQRCQENIHRMWKKAREHNLVFRPHFKTHQSRTIGRWYREAGISKITVSSVSMARYFAMDGWNDITVAFPVNILEISDINELTARISLNLLLSSPENVDLLDRQLSRKAGVYIELDTGYGRSGIDAGQTGMLEKLIRTIQQKPKLVLKGFLSHTGHTYHARSMEEMLRIHDTSVSQLNALRIGLGPLAEGLQFSLGDTPACSISDNFTGMDEIRPGNFVFYDLMQMEIGSCSEDQIAVCAVCPVVARYPERQEVIIYGGAVHLSKDYVEDSRGTKIYGRIVKWNGDSWSSILDNARVSSLSQEHGKIHASAELINQLAPGTLAGIIPVHSCLTADLMKGYLTREGERVDHMAGTMG